MANWDSDNFEMFRVQAAQRISPTNTRIYRTTCYMAGLFPRLQKQNTFFFTNGDHIATLIPQHQTDKYDAWSVQD